MKHFLAYGNSDQASFRTPKVQEAIDYMTVPGTIAAYYPDATAAFVLTSRLAYIIDPRTPLFQGRIARPKASHVSLAAHMGATISGIVGDGSSAVSFSPATYSGEVLQEVAASTIDLQRNYGGRAEKSAEKMDYYRSLLEEAWGPSAELHKDDEERRSPALVLAPYFAVESLDDPWWELTQALWMTCTTLEAPETICPVVAISKASELGQALSAIPSQLSPTTFFWLTGCDERRASIDILQSLWATLEGVSGRRIINLYGSFFSICLGKAGLWGFNNGLGYSESRNWPELTSTGAAPARYYVPQLHMYLPPATARLVLEADTFFQCPCELCHELGARAPTALKYHQLKQHFVLSRSWEIAQVAASDSQVLARELRDAHARFASRVEDRLPPRVRIDTSFLVRWAEVLDSNSN